MAHSPILAERADIDNLQGLFANFSFKDDGSGKNKHKSKYEASLVIDDIAELIGKAASNIAPEYITHEAASTCRIALVRYAIGLPDAKDSKVVNAYSTVRKCERKALEKAGVMFVV